MPCTQFGAALLMDDKQHMPSINAVNASSKLGIAAPNHLHCSVFRPL